MMDQTSKLIGSEHDLGDVCRALRGDVRRLGAPVVGALHLTCSDESELECIQAFERDFVQEMLPGLKIWNRAPFRQSNLGARYEWGALRVAEDHFATPQTHDAFKVLAIKINAHVAVVDETDGPRFGRLERYRRESVACGALHALLDGSREPFARDLAETFASEGLARLEWLQDPRRVGPRWRSLFVAIVNARLQARSAVMDVQEHAPVSPTLFVILPCVTLNRPGVDTEFVCGRYVADLRTPDAAVEYRGLGDDPAKYEARFEHHRLLVEDEHLHHVRPARNHRHIVAQAHRARVTAPPPKDERVVQLLNDVDVELHRNRDYAKAMLRTVLAVAADLTPISAAALLFAEGLVGMYHAHKVHRLLGGLAGDHEARGILEDIHKRIDQLPHAQSEAIIETLLREYRS